MSANICIRCGSRDHTTRDHDEGKAGVKAAAKPTPKKTRPATAGSPNAADKKPKTTIVAHDKCFKTSLKSPGIPDIVDPPFRERNYKDQEQTLWFCRENCTCKACEKKRSKRAADLARRFGGRYQH